VRAARIAAQLAKPLLLGTEVARHSDKGKRDNFAQRGGSVEKLFKRFVQDESGQDLIEYGLLIGIITSAIVGTASAIGTKVVTFYTSLQSNIGA
jgi:Flp pilus assembly pilin Flp